MSEEIYLDYNENTGKFEEPHEPFATIDVETEEDFNRLTKALEDAEKYKWHDLSKDPSDLPHAEYGESDTVLCQKEIGTYILLYFDGGNWCYPTGECYERNKDYQKIIAWKEIEPFVGGGEGD